MGTDGATALRALGYVRSADRYATPELALAVAQALVSSVDAAAQLVGRFMLPPADGPASRPFQTLHIDFGVPLEPRVPATVGRFTALHVPADVPWTVAATRLVPLAALMSQRRWPADDELVRRFAAYGRTHGAWNDADGYLEGSLARIVEAALERAPALPSVKDNAEFLCGSEFDDLDSEERFLADRGLPAVGVTVEVCLQPGELLVFDNMTLAHGRRGQRQPGELRQWVFGCASASVDEQVEFRDRFLSHFRCPAGAAPDHPTP